MSKQYCDGRSLSEALFVHEKYNVHHSTIRRIINNKTYKIGDINAD